MPGLWREREAVMQTIRIQGESEIEPLHWFERRAIHFHPSWSRKPKGLREWARCLWNCDIFYGPVPAVKLIAVVSWLIAWLA